MRKVQVLSLPETIQEKSTFRASVRARLAEVSCEGSGKTTRGENYYVYNDKSTRGFPQLLTTNLNSDEGLSLITSIFPLHFRQRENPIPFA